MSPSTPSPAESRPVALVTGASAGIGKAIVRRLLKDGWVVYGAARRVEKMSDIVDEGAFSLSMDVTGDGSRVATVDEVLSRYGLLPEGAWEKMIAMAVR